MYSQGHLIFIGISLILIVFGVQMSRKYKPPIDKLVRLCFLLSLFLEAAKILTVIEIIPVVEPVVENGALVYRGTGAFAPYIQREHLPLDIIRMLGEKYHLSEAELIRPYIRGLFGARNERRTAGE
ncbi:MAG: hypothetical protein J5941_04550 [Solobacterium sp.]|nr:hypothetical protein [Solobacterium sp.]